MLWRADTDEPYLHQVYEMWDVMIEKVKQIIYCHEGKTDIEESDFYSVVHHILVDRWEKNNTPLHCLAPSLNPSRNGLMIQRQTGYERACSISKEWKKTGHTLEETYRKGKREEVIWFAGGPA